MKFIYGFLVFSCLCVGIFPAQAKTIKVTVEALAFSPANIEAKVGDIIEWDNKDPIQHTATVRGGFDVILPANQVTKQVLKKAESVKYYCRYHPNMTGKLMVKP